MEDKLTGLCINLIYTVYRDCDALVSLPSPSSLYCALPRTSVAFAVD